MHFQHQEKNEEISFHFLFFSGWIEQKKRPTSNMDTKQRNQHIQEQNGQKNVDNEFLSKDDHDDHFVEPIEQVHHHFVRLEGHYVAYYYLQEFVEVVDHVEHCLELVQVV